MNHFAYQLAHNGHLSFKQKCRSLVMQTFGHEALFNVDDLRANSHCYVFNINIYRIGAIEKEYLTKRKLFNPFKWLEFAIAFPFEILSWSLQRALFKIGHHFDNEERSVFKSFILFITNLASFLLSPLVNMLSHIALAIPKRILAPVRYIIRPTIEFARKQPGLFAATLLITLLFSALIAASIFTGGIPLIISGATIAGLIVAKTALAASIAIAAWATFLKLVTGIQEIFGAIVRYINAPWHQPTEKFKAHTSTDKITKTLHAINPKYTLVNKPEEQDCAQTLALTTGTESIFYKPKKTSLTQAESVSNNKRCC